MTLTLRPLERKDYDAWAPMMQANCLHQIADDVLNETWRRLSNPKEQVFGIGAFNDANGSTEKLQGFLHYVLHPTTGFKSAACYMQDLYVDESVRRQGIAKRLVWELHDIGKTEKWSWIYWFAENSNEATQNLYKNLGIKMDFSLHMLQTQD